MGGGSGGGAQTMCSTLGWIRDAVMRVEEGDGHQRHNGHLSDIAMDGMNEGGRKSDVMLQEQVMLHSTLLHVAMRESSRILIDFRGSRLGRRVRISAAAKDSSYSFIAIPEFLHP